MAGVGGSERVSGQTDAAFLVGSDYGVGGAGVAGALVEEQVGQALADSVGEDHVGAAGGGEGLALVVDEGEAGGALATAA